MNGGIFSSSYGCDGNQENGVFVVSISTVVKGKISSAYFREPIYTSIP